MARILLIDDDINLLQMVKLMLTRVGHQVETSNNGDEGILMAAQSQPDLAIIDVMMPGLSGYDVVRKLRHDQPTARIPIIILTARSQPMDKQMALDAGANAFLSKPVTAQELTERVDAVLKAGVDYRVHTGLLTEPARRPPSQPKPPEGLRAATKPERVTPIPAQLGSEPTGAPEPVVTPPERKPIGADDIEPQTTPTPTPPTPTAGLPVITVISLRGGTGSTTVAVNLAALLARQGRRICLADLSTSGGHIPLHLHINPPSNWSQLLPLGDSPDGHAIAQLLVEHQPSGINFLAAPPMPAFQTLSQAASQALMAELSRTFSPVVVDAPHLDPASTGALLLSRSVVIVMSDDPPSVQTTAQFLLALHKLGVEMGRVRVALNHIHDTQDVPAATIQKALKRPLSAEIPYNANHMNAIRRGVPHIIAEPNSPFSQAIQQLARTMGI